MATFITDRTENDISLSRELIEKVKTTPWASLTATEQARYLNENILYEDKGRFGLASASRIKDYLVAITAKSSIFTPWGTKDFKGTYDTVIGTPAYYPINRDHFKAWVDVLSLAYGGNPVQWDFDQKPYLNYELLNRMEFLSKAYFNDSVSFISEKCGMYKCGETFDTFFNIIS